jgi:signal peptidase I
MNKPMKKIIEVFEENTIEKMIESFKEKNLGKKIKVKVKGNCMFPVMPDNAFVEVKVIPSSQLKSGDIMMFYAKKKVFVHRMLKRKSNGLLVKGDNNFDFDPIIKEKNVIGKVEKINNKKVDSLGFSIAKMPIIAFSLATGILSKTIRKAKKGKM